MATACGPVARRITDLQDARTRSGRPLTGLAPAALSATGMRGTRIRRHAERAVGRHAGERPTGRGARDKQRQHADLAARPRRHGAAEQSCAQASGAQGKRSSRHSRRISAACGPATRGAERRPRGVSGVRAVRRWRVGRSGDRAESVAR